LLPKLSFSSGGPLSETVGKAYFLNISALLYKLYMPQHDDLIGTIILKVSH
jgi:hypothetical protein